MSSRFIWHEMFSTNLYASQSFYGELFQYTFEEQDNGTVIFSNQDGPQGAITPIDVDVGLPSNWIGYITVKDVQRAIRKIESLGGRLVILPNEQQSDNPQVIMFTGPEGAPLKAIEGNGSNKEQSLNTGAIAWNELLCSTPLHSFGFIHSLTDWDRESVPMWPANMYHLCKDEDVSCAGIQNLSPELVTSAHWLSYFLCDDLEQMSARVEALGGSLVTKILQMPTLGHYCVALDNMGAVFALLTRPKEKPASKLSFAKKRLRELLSEL